MKELVDLKEDGSFRLNMKYFNYATGLTMINNKFEDLFGQKARNPQKDLLTQFHMDIASSIQSVTEEIILKLTMSLSKEYKSRNLCLAGGVALNCVANGKILKNNIFENIWIQPAAGDAGGSLGAALAFWYKELGNKRNPSSSDDEMRGSYLGPSFYDNQVENTLKSLDAKYTKQNEENLISLIANELKNVGYQVWNGTSHFITKKYYFEKFAYVAKWLFPALMVLIPLWWMRRRTQPK